MKPSRIRINFLDNLQHPVKSREHSSVRFARLYLLSFSVFLVAVMLAIAGVMTSLNRIDRLKRDFARKEAEIRPVLAFLNVQQEAHFQMDSILERLVLWEEQKYVLPRLMQILALSAPLDVCFEEIKIGTGSRTLLSGSTRSVFSVLDLLARLEKCENVHHPVLETMWHKTDKVFFVLSFGTELLPDGNS